MTNYEAISIAEGFCSHDPDEKETLNAWSHIAKNGLHRGLQGWFGRTVEHLRNIGALDESDDPNYDFNFNL